ncbi:MAG: MBL fold metallo-hydrolase [Candidatus Aminicenantes bacterium]|nr:MAG: MBL fold metallo-hydrolase [Candidatus Aminicenantes bacterium]
MKKIIGKLLILILIFVLGLSQLEGKGNFDSPDLKRDLNKGEALIWYLGHAGWAVKTKNHLLIFDYVWVPRSGEIPENPTLANGYIDPAEIGDFSVFVFISHRHGDHFDPMIFKWEKSVENIQYIFGWEADQNPKYFYLTEPRTKRTIDGLEIFNINHAFDGIPEAAFLVKGDDLVIFHSGDHGSTGEVLNPLFKANIDYLSQQENQIDLAFISQFGSRAGGEVNNGDMYTMERLGPKVTFPMHQGGGERFYMKFAQEAQQKGARTRVICAKKQGDRFFYQKGKIK